MSSEQRKARRAAYEARQERKAKMVIRWIAAGLMLILMIWIAYQFV